MTNELGDLGHFISWRSFLCFLIYDTKELNLSALYLWSRSPGANGLPKADEERQWQIILKMVRKESRQSFYQLAACSIPLTTETSWISFLLPNLSWKGIQVMEGLRIQQDQLTTLIAFLGNFFSSSLSFPFFPYLFFLFPSLFQKEKWKNSRQLAKVTK